MPHEGAEPYLGVTMYDELAPASGLVLLRGKVSPGRLSKEEGGDRRLREKISEYLNPYQM